MADLNYLGESPIAAVGQNGMMQADMNKGITPVFHVVIEDDPAATERDGVPRKRETEVVTIFVAGDGFNQVTHPVTAEIRSRFPDQYRAYKEKGATRTLTGTPLRAWAELTPLQIAEFEAAHIYTVENLRDLDDNAVVKLFDGRILREKAGAWLSYAKDAAVATRFAAENARLSDRIHELEQRIAAMGDCDDPVKRGPGRPRKEAA